MRIKANVTNFYLILNFFLFGAEVLFLFYIWKITSYPVRWSCYAFYMTMISLVFNAVYLFHAKKTLSDFRIVFCALSYVFLFGRVWLDYIYPDVQLYWALEDMFPEEIMLKSAVFAACSVQGMFCGLFCWNDEKYEREKKHDEQDVDVALKITGIILLAIAIPCRIYVDFSSIWLVKNTGDYVNAVAGSGLFDDFANLIVPGMICLVESKRKYLHIFIPIGVYMVIIMALTGDRRYSVTTILVMLLYYIRLKENKNFKMWKFLPLIFLGIFFVNFLDFIREARLVSPENMFSVLTFSSLFNLSGVFVDFLTEFGISFFSLVSIVENVPELLGYQCGLTLFYTLPSILPVGFLMGDWFKMASPSNVINSAISLPVGATLFGDMYANYGVIIALFFPVIGIILNKVIKPITKQQHGIEVVLYYSKYFFLVNLVRSSIFELFRGTIWCTIIPLLIYNIFKRKYINR